MIKGSKLGSGAYGVVYSGKFELRVASVLNSKVVVKRNRVDIGIDFAVSIRELDICLFLKGHPNVVSVMSVSHGDPFGGGRPMTPIDDEFRDDHIHFIFERGITDLATLIDFENIPYLERKMFLMDTLLGLEYMHGQGYIHRDIKTPNLLVFDDDTTVPITGRRYVKLCDFGMSKPFIKGQRNTPRTITSWYRPPNMCLDSNQYGPDADMWSVGCVFYELLTGKPLCLDAKDEANNEDKVLNCYATKLPKVFFKDLDYSEEKTIEKRSGTTLNVTMEQFVTSLGLLPSFYNDTGVTVDVFIDFIKGLLNARPDKRLSATQALDHDFFADQRQKIKETRSRHSPIFDFNNVFIKTVRCQDRLYIFDLIFDLYKKKKNTRGGSVRFSNRIIFQSVSLFDRYLVFKKAEHKGPVDPDTYFSIHSKEGAILRYLVCLYLSQKYFLAVSKLFRFSKLKNLDERCADPKCIKFAEDFEEYLLSEVYHYKIYEPTLYEYECYRLKRDINDKDAKVLLYKMKSCEYNGVITNYK